MSVNDVTQYLNNETEVFKIPVYYSHTCFSFPTHVDIKYCKLRIFHVKSFSDKQPCIALSLIMHIIFVCLISTLAMLSENTLINNENFPIYGIVVSFVQAAK